MIRCILVDDEPRNNQILQNLLETWCPGVQVEAVATSVENAINLSRFLKPDVVFLDIEMPGQNAFDFLQAMRPVSFEVVFVTAFDQYAIKAFRYGAVDYLLKPVNIDELKETTRRILSRKRQKNINERIELYLDNLQAKQASRKLAIPSKDGFVFHDTEDILYCIAEGAYTSFILSGGKKLISTGTLKHFEELLPEADFFRINHSALVNLKHVTSYNKGRGGFVIMTNGEKIEVAQRKKEEFLALFEKK